MNENGPENYTELKKLYTREYNKIREYEHQQFHNIICMIMRKKVKSGNLSARLLYILDGSVDDPMKPVKKENAYRRKLREEKERLESMTPAEKNERERKAEEFRQAKLQEIEDRKKGNAIVEEDRGY